MPRTEDPKIRHPAGAGHGSATIRRGMAVILTVAVVSGGAYLAYDQYRVGRMAGMVRRSFAGRQFAAAREPLRRWLQARPRSAEAQYYRAWLALIDDQAREAADAIGQARELGIDPTRLGPLAGIYQARGDHTREAEPLLRTAFDQKQEPQAEVARELARIYLTSYRFAQATEVIERWRTLDPENPQPYLWSNEVAARSETEPSILIRNYRAALERDPNLDQARLGLAEQLSRARRFDEAEQEYHDYLRRNPNNAPALVGLGRNAFHSGDIDRAIQFFESALKVDPRQPEALKELAQADLRLGRLSQACRRFERLVEIEPYDHEIRYSYSQALRLKGDEPQARSEAERAARLRQEHDHILQLRSMILKDPADVQSRFEVARWMLEHGHFEEGLKWTREILRIDPRHAPTHQVLANYYQKQGDSGLANYHRLLSH